MEIFVQRMMDDLSWSGFVEIATNRFTVQLVCL